MQPSPTESPAPQGSLPRKDEAALHSERVRELVALQIELLELSFSTDLDGILARVVQSTCQLLHGQACILSLIDETNHEWMIRKAWGPDIGWADQAYPIQDKGLVRACMEMRQAISIANLPDDERYDPSSDGLAGVQPVTGIFAPLLYHEVPIGALAVLQSAPGHPVRENGIPEEDLVLMAAGLAAATIQSTRLVRELTISNADLEANRWELINSRNMLRALFDNLPAGLYIIDRSYHLAAINSARAQRAGSTSQILAGQICYQSLFQRNEPCSECQVMTTFNSGIAAKRREHRWDEGRGGFSHSARKRAGSDVRLVNDSSEWEIHAYPIPDENGQISQAILLEQDITEKYRLESVLAQSEKLAVIGQLAAGVAHEINNPLTAIIANAQILHRELPANHDLQESVDLIARAGARAAQVVRNLLDYARKEEYRLGMTDINETLERALELVRHELVARGIQIEFAPGTGLPPILASQDHLQSVWLNLLLNAVNSLDKRPAEVRLSSERIGNEIHVTVKDNGKGIPPENLARVFEPFYTTKAPGKGTGLGLSVSYRIVQQHGGQIRVESRPGAGSKFTVILPLV